MQQSGVGGGARGTKNHIQDKQLSKCKGPGAEARVALLKNSQKVSMAGVE